MSKSGTGESLFLIGNSLNCMEFTGQFCTILCEMQKSLRKLSARLVDVS